MDSKRKNDKEAYSESVLGNEYSVCPVLDVVLFDLNIVEGTSE